MYILVRLLKGFPKPLFYEIPNNLNDLNLIGKIVNVPIRTIDVPALVLKTYTVLPKNINFKIKQINNLQRFPQDSLFNSFIEKVAKFYFLNPLYFYQRIRSFLLKEEKVNNKSNNTLENKNSQNITLTNDQEEVFKFIFNLIGTKKYCPTLLHGVTGSGKTEIYKKLIIETTKQNKTTILLLPEVSLAMQFEILLKKQLPSDIKIIGFHSASKISEKKRSLAKFIK
ncbi:MAG: DEAD/DEAH box helicase [bacterium]